MLIRQIVLIKGQIVERFNGIQKNVLNKVLQVSGKNDWPLQLRQIADNLNNSYQASVKGTPAKAPGLEGNDLQEVNEQMQTVFDKRHPSATELFYDIGTQARLINKKKIKQGKLSQEPYTFTEQIYTVFKRFKANPKTNVVNDICDLLLTADLNTSDVISVLSL